MHISISLCRSRSIITYEAHRKVHRQKRHSKFTILYPTSCSSRQGHVTIRPEDDEDMWHLYNLIQQDDLVRAPAIRYEVTPNLFVVRCE